MQRLHRAAALCLALSLFAVARDAHATRTACANAATLLPVEYVDLITANVSGCGFSGGPGPQWRIQAVTPSTTTVAASCPVAFPDPVGFVVTKSNVSTGSCAGQTAKALARPSTTTTTVACSISVIPPGFVIISSNLTNANCPVIQGQSNGPSNTIRLPVAAGDTVCSISAVPSPFVITRYGTSSSCPSPGVSSGPTKTIRTYTLAQAGAGVTVCAGSPVPDDFVFIATGSYANCATSGNGTSGPGWKIAQPVDGGVICAGNIPADFSIVNFTAAASQCATGVGMTINHPSPNGSSECIVAGHLPPPGYVISAVNLSTTGCNPTGGGTGPGRTVKVPTASGQVCCTGSVTPSNWVITRYSNVSQCSDITGTPKSRTILQPSSTQNTDVCAGSTVPAGFAIIASPSVSGCESTGGGGAGPGLRIGPVSSGTTICGPPTLGLGVIPAGYIVSRITTNTACPENQRAFVVTQPANTGTTFACTINTVIPPMPPGFVINSFAASQSACGDPPAGFGTSYNVLIPDPTPGNTTLVCAASTALPLPAGFVKVATSTYSQCSASTGVGYQITVPAISGVTTICDATAPVPPEYVTVANINTTACADNLGRQIQRPSQSGDTIVCSGSNIPSGFVQVAGSATNYDQCAPGASTGPGFKVRLLGTVPTPFVGTEPDVTTPPPAPTPFCPTPPSTTFPSGTSTKNTAVCP
jgi:hypothetical protein